MNIILPTVRREREHIQSVNLPTKIKFLNIASLSPADMMDPLFKISLSFKITRSMSEMRKAMQKSKYTKIWATLITKMDYLSGLLTLDYSLKKSKSKYPLVAFYTDQFPQEGRQALQTRSIPNQRIEVLLPRSEAKYVVEARFLDCWSKLTAFGLVEYERIVLLDSDMLVMKNMDELVEMELDSPELAGTGSRVFAAVHACVCNPLKKKNYPVEWTSDNCAFTTQHNDALLAQINGPSVDASPLDMINGGLIIINPSKLVYYLILDYLNSDAIHKMQFAEQSLLSVLFKGRWVSLPYIYNALKTMRWEGVHAKIWRDNCVKNIHYILTPKPWDDLDEGRIISEEPTHQWWADTNSKRLKEEKEKNDCPFLFLD